MELKSVKRLTPTLVVSLVSLCWSGCALVNKMAANGIAGVMEATGDVWASGDDPELVCQSVPFALSTIEGLLTRQPDSEELLLKAITGFAQYAYVCVETEAILLEEADYVMAREQEERALRLYLRATTYGLRGLELKYPGITRGLMVDPESTVASTNAQDVPLLYWTAATWGAAISRGRDRPELIADLPAVIAMMERVLELDEAFGGGAVHEVFIMIEGLPASLGGSPEKAREHFERALQLNKGLRASTYATYASLALPEQNRQEFERLMLAALAVDPDADPGSRLQNLIAQKRARRMLDRVDDLFIE